jgi:hypothetical protein
MRAESTVVLVEGESDRRAVVAAARRLEVDLAAAGADVVAMHGVTNLRRHLAELDARPAPPRILGLFDIGEQDHVARMLAEAGRERRGPRPARPVPPERRCSSTSRAVWARGRGCGRG